MVTRTGLTTVTNDDKSVWDFSYPLSRTASFDFFTSCEYVVSLLSISTEYYLICYYVIILSSMFISNCNITLHVSDAFYVHPQEHLKTVVTASGVWHEKG